MTLHRVLSPSHRLTTAPVPLTALRHTFVSLFRWYPLPGTSFCLFHLRKFQPSKPTLKIFSSLSWTHLPAVGHLICPQGFAPTSSTGLSHFPAICPGYLLRAETKVVIFHLVPCLRSSSVTMGKCQRMNVSVSKPR